VLTSYGAGVVVGYGGHDDKSNSCFCYKVRLWRIPGRSMASSSLGYLNENTVRTPFGRE